MPQHSSVPLPQRLTGLYVAGLLLLLGGCSGSGSRLSGTEDSPAGFGALLPAPSALLDDAEREASYIGISFVRDGAEYEALRPHQRAAIDGDNVEFGPSFEGAGARMDGLAYCLYVFSMETFKLEEQARLIWDGEAPAAGECWLGISDFSRDSWKWFPVSGNETVSLPELAALPQPGSGILFIAVAVGGTSTHSLKRLRLGQPEVILQPGINPQSGPLNLVIQASPPDFAIEGAEIDSIELDWDNDGVFEDQTTATLSRELTVAGDYPVNFRLNTDEGPVEGQQVIHALSGIFELSSVAAGGGAGNQIYYQPYIALVGGRPMLACVGFNEFASKPYLEMRVADNPSATSWSGPYTPNSLSGDVIHGLTEVDQRAALLFSSYNTFSEDYTIRLLMGGDASGQNWAGDTVELFGSYVVEPARHDAAVAGVDGYPSVVWIDSAFKARFTQAIKRDGSSWPFQGYEITGNAQQVALGEFSGYPGAVVRYFNAGSGSNEASMFVSSSLAGAIGSWTPHGVIDSGFNPVFCQTSYGPGFAAFSPSLLSSFLWTTTDPLGQSGWFEIEIYGGDNTPHVGAGRGNTGEAFVCFHDAGSHDIRAGDVIETGVGSFSFDADTFASSGELGENLTLCISEGRPVMAFENASTASVVVAVYR